jgi:holo-[acyl-carrier protein] synthase
VGVDLVGVPRFRRALQRRPSLAGRLFSEEERAYAARFPDPAERLAARFAAKEAAMKALGTGLFSVRFLDLRVTRGPGGAPGLELSGRALELARRRGVERFLVSLTHTDEMAQAVVVAVGPGSPPLAGSAGPDPEPA